MTQALGARRVCYFAGVIIHQIFISAGHNYFGHAGREPDQFPLEEVARVECVAGRGLRGDRFFDFKDDYQGQVTFFAREVFEWLQAQFPGVEKSAGALRRNVLVSGADLQALIGKEFELQGVRFRGTQHCKPCFWMDTAFAPGAFEALKGKGGLRAEILSDGWLTTGVAELALLA